MGNAASYSESPMEESSLLPGNGHKYGAEGSSLLPGNGHKYGAEGSQVLGISHGRVQPTRPGNVHIVTQTLHKEHDIINGVGWPSC